MSEPKDERIAYQLYKGGCFGTCPVYTLSVYNTGKITYDGKMHTDYMGMHTSTIGKAELASLQKAFSDADFFSMQEVYESRIPDLPLTRLMYDNGTKAHRVEGKENLPEKAKKLAQMLSDIAERSVWKPTQDNTAIREHNAAKFRQYHELKKESDYTIDYDYVVIETFSTMVMPTWIKGKRALGFSLVEKSEESNNTYILTYDKKKLGTAQVLEILRSDRDVDNVYFKKIPVKK